MSSNEGFIDPVIQPPYIWTFEKSVCDRHAGFHYVKVFGAGVAVLWLAFFVSLLNRNEGFSLVSVILDVVSFFWIAKYTEEL